MVPTPPEIARQRPQPLLQRCDKTIERAGLTDHRSDLGGSFRQHPNFVFAEGTRFNGLNHQNTLQHASIDQGNT